MNNDGDDDGKQDTYRPGVAFCRGDSLPRPLNLNSLNSGTLLVRTTKLLTNQPPPPRREGQRHMNIDFTASRRLNAPASQAEVEDLKVYTYCTAFLGMY